MSWTGNFGPNSEYQNAHGSPDSEDEAHNASGNNENYM